MMNKQEQDIFLEILCSVLWKREPDISLLCGNWTLKNVELSFSAIQEYLKSKWHIRNIDSNILVFC